MVRRKWNIPKLRNVAESYPGVLGLDGVGERQGAALSYSARAATALR